MRYENIRVEKKNQIAYVTIARPKVLNALSIATIEELRRAFHDLKNDSEVRVAIITGEGEKAFVAGADIQELSVETPVTGKEYSRRGHAVFELIENLGKPVIAAINGFALGGGCELAMACTIRLATPNAKFGQPEVKLGIIPGVNGTQRLPRIVGKGMAMQLLLTGDMISAEEAYRIGLVNEVVAAGELMARAEAIAKKNDCQCSARGALRHGGGQPGPGSDHAGRIIHRGRAVRNSVRDRGQSRRHARFSGETPGTVQGQVTALAPGP